MLRTIFAATVLLLGLSACFADTPAPSPDKAHYVFAHYMVCFGSSKEFYKREIELAQRHGIDGFALNCGEWMNVDPKTGQFSTPTHYRPSADNMFAAAKELGTGFKLFFSADMMGIRPVSLQMNDMVARYYDHPNQFRWHGKAVISAWAGVPDTFVEPIATMKAKGYDVAFVPYMSNPRHATNWSAETVRGYFDGHPHVDGIFHFGADNTTGELIRNNATARRVTSQLGKIYMAGVTPAYNSPNLRDYHGMEGYGAVWQGFINDNADWVEIVTWNDYIEDSGLVPFRWGSNPDKPYYDRDEAFLDVTSYYASWFKTGKSPAITQDKLYYVYRNRSKNMTQAWDEAANKWVSIDAIPAWCDQIHEDVLDNVYVTTFLTAPADLTVKLGSTSHTYQLPAGVQTSAVPMAPGVPHLTLTRQTAGRKQTIIDTLARKQIIGVATKTNSAKGVHLPNRTWTGGDVSGTVLRLEAVSGKLGPSTSVVKMGSNRLVQFSETPDSGFRVPISGLKTGTYSVRFVYNNPADDESRLTIISDGPPASATDRPYTIPAFLPPTGKEHIATTSLLWSLYDSTSFISVTWQPAPKGMPDQSDIGAPKIQAIELVKIDDVVPAAVKPTVWPELVSIPGGSFKMGSTKGAPSELPVHSVTLSPFWIGKCEVTNAEYERFDPTHKAYRDTYSWRDADPVIYVSWNDGAKYCNWLSKQAGLDAVYDEKTMKMDIAANGFRMPTEAQWEYCASGRGEGRTYPWGNEPPDATRGNFAGEASLTQSASIRLPDTGGTVAVGGFPLGASRDGVLDLAGNVVQWCSDYYQPYTPDAQVDPCNQTPANFRSIRGGSFGYYGHTQRASSREFNSPGYPGYIYLGLRVALPASGAKVLGL
ncbi:MAG TPA: endo-1,3-alpha-glucanase family glycosylhydrolase [Capsulimonadaceae bacterium]